MSSLSQSSNATCDFFTLVNRFPGVLLRLKMEGEGRKGVGACRMRQRGQTVRTHATQLRQEMMLALAL
jgi:hypothetical protein